jgi:pyridine nucleotide-disulfide oxidoreductase family protein
LTSVRCLLLVGAGHSHVEILRRQILEPRSELSLTVVSAGPLHHYSGMVPGFLRGSYTEEEISFHLPTLVARAGGEFVEGKAVSVDPVRRAVVLEDGRTLAYDLASFGVGSLTRGGRNDGVRRFALSVKPIRKAIALRQALLQLARREGAARVAVVGAGAAGIEIACAAAGVLDAARRRREVVVVDGSDRILPGYSDRFRSRAESILKAKGITARLGERVREVRESEVLTDRGTIPSHLTVWLTGPEASEIFAGSGLETDDRGFLLVDDSLRSVTDPRVFGVGDCATLASHPNTPKAGVYAVREGPVLWESLNSAIDGTEPPRYTPQRGFLSILNTGEGKALLRYKGLVSWSRAAWILKDWIDRRFMRRYQVLARGVA